MIAGVYNGFMIFEIAGYISGALMIASFFPYIRDIFLHKTKPERASWAIWAALGGIAFFSQLAKGASYSLFLVGFQALGDFSVFLLSVKYGIGGLLKRDIVGLAGAGLSLVLWYFTRDAAVALFIVIGIDAISGILTIIKSYEGPETETVSTWVLTCLSGIFAAVAVGSFNFVLLSFPVYISLICFAILVSIYLGRRRKVTAGK